MAQPQLPETPSTRQHKRQFTWQILVPIITVTVLILAAAGMIASRSASQARVWADVSIIWLIAPLLFFALFILAMLVLFIYGITRLIQVTPGFTARLQSFIARLGYGTTRVADGAAGPFIWLQQTGAAFKAVFGKAKKS